MLADEVDASYGVYSSLLSGIFKQALCVAQVGYELSVLLP